MASEVTRVDVDDMPPLIRTKYRFKKDAPCPLCGHSTADTTLEIDLNAPLRDLAAVFDDSITNLPCCGACKAAYVRRDRLSHALPAPLGYIASLIHRAGYRGKVRAWLSHNADAVQRMDKVPPAVKREMTARALSLLGYSGCAIAFGVAATLMSQQRGVSIAALYVLYWLIAVGGGIGLIVGALRWLRWMLAL